MPYIKQDDRVKYYPAIDELLKMLPRDDTLAGEINFVISKLLKLYVDHNGRSYKTYNTLVGALECIKLELYRTRVAPYEDKCIEKNGDI